MNNPLVSVGMVTWNSDQYLDACLESLCSQNYKNIELVVVDNSSLNDPREVIRRYFPNVTYIQNSSNNGFCGGHNQAIEATRGDFYLPLNPDVALDPGYISALVEAVETDPEAGSAASKLYLGSASDHPRRIDSTGLFIDRKRRQYLRGFGMEETGLYNRPEEVFGVDGAAPLYRRSMLEDIKIFGQYFDEAFFAHKEDVDLSWRARMFGWKCIYTPYAFAFHQRNFKSGKRQGITNEIKLHAVKNRYLLLLKNESAAGWKRDGAQILYYDLKILAYLILFERSSLKAFKLIRQNWKTIQSWRQEINTRSKISPDEILRWFI